MIMRATLIVVSIVAIFDIVSTKTFGQYSFLPANFAKAKSAALKTKVSDGFVEELTARDRETDTHVFNIEVPEEVSDKVYHEILSSGMGALHNRLMKANTVLKDKESKCVLGEDALIATFKSKWTPFFGWTTYSMVRNDNTPSILIGGEFHKQNKKKAKKIEELIITTASLEERGKGAQCVIRFKALLREDRTIQLVVDCNTWRIPKKERKLLLSKFREMWRVRVLNALMVASSRVKQKQVYNAQSAETLRRIKERALDKKINPEKYKSQSPTVRRTGGNGGRYDPSQGARERASAKRRTQVIRRGG